MKVCCQHRRVAFLVFLVTCAGIAEGLSAPIPQASRGESGDLPNVPAFGAPPVFSDGFEDADELADLFPRDGSRWTSSQVEPAGNSVELTSEQVHGGTQALKCYAQPYDGRNASKADIATETLTFVVGDEVWAEMWVYLVGGGSTLSVFLWDLEAPATCTTTFACPKKGIGRICNSPGRRLYLSGPQGDWLKSDMGKWCVGQPFTQAPGTEVALPTDEWVRIRAYLQLSEKSDGVMKVWQGDELVIDAVGITLPRYDAVYSRLQVGITANGNESFAHTMYLDDVTVWDASPAWGTE